MLFRRLATLLGMMFLLGVPPAWAWGPEGHEVVAHVAALNLTPRARIAITSLLGGEAEAMMALDANWADEIRDDRPETSSWHYVNMEIDGSLHYGQARDCPREQCVVAQILRDEDVLRHGSAAQKAEALRFLIHFAGDIRQPLHAGENHDSGGNRVTLLYRGARTNLHHIWDDDVVAVQGRDPVALAHTINAAFTPGQKKLLGAGTPADWANDSAHLARDAIYRPLLPQPPRALPDNYPASNAVLARLQLAKAGFSLAALLNDAFR